METRRPRHGRNVGLDVIRFVAVLLVLGRHAAITSQSPTWMQAWACGGWVGVDLFFVMSGFLVSGLLFAEYDRIKRIRPVRFLIRRGFKIYPPFWIFMLVTYCYQAWFGAAMAWQSVLVELAFVQNYFAGIWIHTWSLAVEEHFYFFLAALLASLGFAGRVDSRWGVPVTFAMLAIGCLLLRLHQANLRPTFEAGPDLFRTHVRMDSLFFGVFISYLSRYTSFPAMIDRIPAWILIAAGCVMMSPAFFWPVHLHVWIRTYGLTMFYLGGGLMVMAVIRPRSVVRTPSAAALALARLGAASYSVYLWHLPVHFLTRDLFVDKASLPIAYWTSYVIGSFVVGMLMHWMVERPAMAVRNRWVR